MTEQNAQSVTPASFYASNPPKTPRKRKTPPPQDTPTHRRLPSSLPFTSTAVYKVPVFVAAANEMKDKFVGGVSPSAFLDVFLSDCPDGMPAIDVASFDVVTSMTKEPEMYNPLITALSPFCGNDMHLVNTSATPDPNSTAFLRRQVKPDISCYSKTAPKGSCITRAHDMETFIELKNREIDEPYCDRDDAQFERDTMDARDTRGQLTTYLNAIQATQHRTHTFGVFINRHLCRLLRHTRSCTIVTEAFDYTTTTHLPSFFWRFTHADATTRGHDETFKAVDASSSEAKKACTALHLSSSSPLFKVSVTDSVTHKITFYVVNSPLSNTDIFPVGRGTRCYRAYDCQTHGVVLLKDTWRVEKYLPEGDVYRKLHDAGVSYIAGLITAGNVHGSTHRCGDIHDIRPRTIGRSIRRHVHYRLVLDTVGEPLTDFSSTWELVNAVTCALICHSEATTKANILHRDISVGNILITSGGNGILIDWELSKDLGAKTEARVNERTGTWQFMSVRLLEGTSKVHRVGDDLESFTHVLAWVAARYAPNSMTPQKRGEFLRVFDSTVEDSSSKERILLADMVTITKIKISQKQFRDVLCALWHGFACRYGSYYVLTQSEDAAEKLRERLETHDWMINTLKDALKDRDWELASDDGAVNQELPIPDESLTEGQRKKRKSNLSEYTRSTAR